MQEGQRTQQGQVEVEQVVNVNAVWQAPRLEVLPMQETMNGGIHFPDSGGIGTRS